MVVFSLLVPLLVLTFQICSPVSSYQHYPRGKCNVTQYPVECHVSASFSNEPSYCKIQRLKSIEMSRKYYKLTRLGQKETIQFPLRFLPFLNQTMDTVKFVTAMDPIDSRWLTQLSTMRKAIEMFGKQLQGMFSGSKFTTMEDYIKIYKAHNSQIEGLHIPHIFSNPSLYKTFTDIIRNDRFLSDDVFVQRRLAGPCPFLLKRVTFCGTVGMKWSILIEMLNQKFDFDASVNDALKGKQMTLVRAVEEERLYVLYHKEHDNIPTAPDYYDKNQALINETSPITLFVRTRTGDLKVVAIQIDYKNSSEVFTPKSDILKWIVAKTMVNSADLNVCQALWHLSHVHFSSGVYCTIYKSHFSPLHPIFQIMQHHCEGTTPHIALTYGALIAPHQYLHRLFAISNSGYLKLAVDGHKQFTYDTLAYDELLKRQGLDNNKIMYHPFRDDGLVIWGTLMGFAGTFTRTYYKHDNDVREDLELQSFARQVSIDGGDGDMYGGKGNIVGFPSEFNTKGQVKTFLTRFLWQIAMHSAVNYPLEPWSSFVPMTPLKMYDHQPQNGESHKDFLAKSSPSKDTTIGTISFTELLGNLRINRIFDYYGKIEDRRLSSLVKKYHRYLFSCVQDQLMKRNKARKENQQVGFQYFEPIWLTNSIHV